MSILETCSKQNVGSRARVFAALWLCGSVALWLCGSVALCPCDPVALWPCGPVALWSCGPVVLLPCCPVAMLPCGPVVLWSCGPVVLWPCGPVVFGQCTDVHQNCIVSHDISTLDIVLRSSQQVQYNYIILCEHHCVLGTMHAWNGDLCIRTMFSIRTFCTHNNLPRYR